MNNLLESLGLLLSHFLHRDSPHPYIFRSCYRFQRSNMLQEISSKSQRMGRINFVYKVYTLIYRLRCWNINPNFGYTGRRQKFMYREFKKQSYIHCNMLNIRSVYKSHNWAQKPQEIKVALLGIRVKTHLIFGQPLH